MTNVIPFDQIRDVALSHADRLLREWFPLGRTIGREFKIGNLNGEAGESLSVNLDKGVWRDFAGGESGHDLIDLYAATHATDRVAAARELGKLLGVTINGYSRTPKSPRLGEPRTAAHWVPMVPPPPGTPRPEKAILDGFDQLHKYTDSNGRVTHYVGRIEGKNGQRKQFVPLTFGMLHDKLGWHRKAPAIPRPLYGLNRLAAMPDSTVILCEGEKSADAAHALFPDYACLAWSGGARSVAYADVRPLLNRNVIVWPDNDADGANAAASLMKLLPHACLLRVDDLEVAADAADVAPDDPDKWLQTRLAPRIREGTMDDIVGAPVNMVSQMDPATRNQMERFRRSIRWLTPAECTMAEPRGYIIKDLLAPGDLALIFGGPGLGKSCLAPRLAYHVAQGREIFGRRVRKGRVLYVACEDPHGMRQRIAALRTELGDTTDLLLASGGADFMTTGSPHRAELEKCISEFQPAVVFIDTIAAGFPGLKENDAGFDGMGAVVTFARELIVAYGVAVVLLHHVPKNDAGTPRGHGLLHGDADVALALSRNADKTIRGAFTKNRNGPSDGAVTFAIRVVSLGIDADGDAITAPIAEPMEVGMRTGPKLSPQATNAKRYLADLISSEGKPLPSAAGFPSTPLHGADEGRWREECDSRRLSTADNSENRSRAFRAAYQQLRNAGIVAARDGWVWLTHPEEGGFS